jgi:UDP-glucose 4-epimerase
MRRRPDIGVSVLRLTSLIGPTVDSPIARYLTMPLVPTPLGYDPRLQLLHEDDAVEVMRQATVDGHPGVFNVAGDGVITLAQAIRRAGRVRVPVPSRALTAVGTAVRNSGALELTAEHATFLSYGRAVDTTRLKTVFGYSPKYTSQTALASFIDAHPALPRLRIAALSFVDGLAGRVTERLADASGAHPVPPHSARSLQGARS